MSTIPLSVAIQDGLAPDPDREPDATPAVPPGSFNHDKFDEIARAAVDRLMPDDDAEPVAPTKRGLDAHLSEAIDAHDAKEDADQSFAKSREYRDELQAYYGDQGDIGETIDKYIQWAKYFRENPQEAGEKFAASFYAAGSKYGLKDHAPKPKAEAYVDASGTRHSGKVLDEKIWDAINNSTKEKQDRIETDKRREELKKLMPGKSFDEALKTIAQINRDAHRDPLVTAATVAAAFGLPVFEHQHQEQDVRNKAQAVIAQGVQHLPGLADAKVKRAVATILERPEFPVTGNMQHDLQLAHQIHQVFERQNAQVENWAQGALSRMEPQQAKAVTDIIMHDEHFRAQAARNVASKPYGDPTVQYANFELARGMALQRARSVSKARKALPVRSSSGATGGAQPRRGLEAHIAAALAGWKD